MVMAVPAPERAVVDAGTDLPSLACEAAVEIDNLARGRNGDLSAVRALADTITKSVTVDQPSSPASLLNPTTAVVLRRAIGAVTGAGQPRKLDELLSKASEIAASLRSVAATPETPPMPRTLEELRAFCVALSNSAAAARRPPIERPEHPFRRS